MYLFVSIKGTKTWKFDYRLDGKTCAYTLGRFPGLSLHDARELRSNAARLVRSESTRGRMKNNSSNRPSSTTRTRFGLSVRNG
ncbi:MULTISPECIES: Arm DNA-binding domain-containing protein [Paraburkholderia]|uniref:Arm DNA-binding domain-containing protein n=1 Tax=Paraburkholderia TaxID=1822464 RepID=UPI0038621B2B